MNFTLKTNPILTSLFAFLFLVSLSPFSSFAGDCITPIEAVHLVEFQVNYLTVTDIQFNESTKTYTIEGKVGLDGYRAIVDADVARVKSISRNDVSIYEWEGILVVGHRGTVKFAPENTIAALVKAIELGADLLEIDIRETKDGHLILMHDVTVNRTTNGSGPIAEMTLQEVKKLDAGSWFSPEFKGEKVPTLKEALTAIRGRALPDIDFKAGDPQKLVKILREENLLGKVTLYCGNWDLLQATLEISDDFFIRPTVPIGKIGLPLLIDQFDPPIVNIDWPEFSEALIRDIHLVGKKAFMNTMGANDNEFGMMSSIKAGADYIQTDHLDILLPMLRAKGLHD